MSKEYIRDDASLEMEAADDRHNAAHCEDAELAAYYSNVDAARPVQVNVRRRIAADTRYFIGVQKQLGAVMALFGGAK